KRRSASTAPPPAPVHPLRLSKNRGRFNSLLWTAGRVSTETGGGTPTATPNLVTAQTGMSSDAFAGLVALGVQVSMTVPVYPVLVLTVIWEIAVCPAGMDAGAAAL